MEREERRRLGELLAAGLSAPDLRTLLITRFGVELDDVTTVAHAPTMIDDILVAAIEGGWDRDFLVAILPLLPLDEPGIALFTRIGVLQPAHEALIHSRDPFVRTSDLSRTLVSAEARVFAVEIDGRHSGTAFLIGPDLGLTNHHVVEVLLRERAGDARTRIKARFDFTTLGPGRRIYELAEEWHVAGSRHHPYDCVAGEHDCAHFVDALDFAVIRLADPVGLMSAPGASGPRGWYGLAGVSEAPPRADQRVYVIGHPQGLPLSHDEGRILAVNDNATRLRYRLNTTHGVSGGPCISVERGLVAVHSSGDPAAVASGRPAGYNQGVPIASIVAKLREEALDHLIVQPLDETELLQEVGPNEPVLDRERLQRALRNMRKADGRRVLVVDGEPGSGRQFATPIVLRLAERLGQTCIPISLESLVTREPDAVCRRIALELGLDPAALPPPQPDRQTTRWPHDLAAWIAGHCRNRYLKTGCPLWFVFDRIGDFRLPQETGDFIVELARRALDMPEIRVVVIGWSEILPTPMRSRAEAERTTPIVPDDVSRYLVEHAARHSERLPRSEAEELAMWVFADLPPRGGDAFWITLLGRLNALRGGLQ